jgi:hypothetical protein
MPTLNDVLLKRIIRNPLSEIGYRVSEDRDGHWDLKSLLVSGYLSIESISEGSGRCKLSIGEEVYYDALESSVFTGFIRYMKQSEVFDNFKTAKLSPAAWNIVTLYYACFFCVIELLRISGTWSLFLTTSDAQKINEKNIVGSNLSSGTYFVSIDNLNSTFQAYMTKAEGSGGGFHQIVWDRFKSLISIKQSQLTDAEDRNRYRALVEGLSSKKSPSVLRNKWNYRDPLLFSSKGDSIGLKTIYSSNREEQDWVKTFRNISSDNDEIFSLLNIYKLSSNLINNGLRYIFPERKLIQIKRNRRVCSLK